MMFPPDLMEMIAHGQHADRLQEVELQRLINSLPPKKPRYRQAMIWLGAKLVTLGWKLQGQNATPAAQVGREPLPSSGTLNGC